MGVVTRTGKCTGNEWRLPRKKWRGFVKEDVVVFKKVAIVRDRDIYSRILGYGVLELTIPKRARGNSSEFTGLIFKGGRYLRSKKTYKYRFSKAIVGKLFPLFKLNKNEKFMVRSMFNNGEGKEYFYYPEEGEIVVPENPFDNSREACASGIHAFDNYEDAKNY